MSVILPALNASPISSSEKSRPGVYPGPELIFTSFELELVCEVEGSESPQVVTDGREVLFPVEGSFILVFFWSLAANWDDGSFEQLDGNNSGLDNSHQRCGCMASSIDFESLVARFYESLYHFAFSLTRTEADACDLTQQTFYVWACKGHQLRDESKVKTWLFTTLYREFLETRRKQTRFPHYELSQVNGELPTVSPTTVNQMDSTQVLHALAQADELFRAPLALFYLEDYSYSEIAEILGVPLGTVKSRISRGMAQLHRALTNEAVSTNRSRKDPSE